MIKHDFDPDTYKDAFIRCVSDQLSLMEKYFLLEHKGNGYKAGIAAFHRAQLIINSQLVLSGYEPLDMYWFYFEEAAC